MNEYTSFAADFSRLCRDNHNRTLIVVVDENGKKKFSYADVEHIVDKMLTLFRKSGLKKGDTVVSIMPNSVECITCFFAALKGGYGFAPLACQVTNREFDNWLDLVKPRLIIKKQGVADYTSDIKVLNCNCDGDLSWLPESDGIDTGDNGSKVYLLTSGTTGTPKAMVIDGNKLWSSGIAFANCYGMLDSAVRFWNYLPMSYLGGLYNLALIPMCCGGSFVISEPFSGKTIINYWSFVQNNEITALWIVPSILQGLLKIAKLTGGSKKKNNLSTIKIAFIGTAPVQLTQKEEFEEMFGFRLYENFALSESTFLTAESEDNIRYREQSSVGKPLPYVSLKLKPVDGIANTNTIWIKSPYLFDGYLDKSGSVELELDEDGFFNSKDLGYINSDGVLVLAGRNRDIIKKGGLFVSLVEIEDVINKLPEVEEATAVPIPSNFYGETYVLCVVFKKNIEGQKEKLHAWMLENFVKYKLPDKIYTYTEFPRTASGKIQKKVIAEGLVNK